MNFEPKIKIMNPSTDKINLALSRGQELTLELLRARLSGRDTVDCDLSPDEWEQVIAYAVGQRGVLLLYDYFRKSSSKPPDTILATMKKMYFNNAVRNQRFESELAALNRLFSDAGISFMPLKGIVLSHQVYGNPSLRPSADLDILVQPGDLQAAFQLLLERGYIWGLQMDPLREKVYRKTTHHWTLVH